MKKGVYGNGCLEIAWDRVSKIGGNSFLKIGGEKSVLGKGYVEIRYWELLRSLFFLKKYGHNFS